jgi:hypothetical protein
LKHVPWQEYALGILILSKSHWPHRYLYHKPRNTCFVGNKSQWLSFSHTPNILKSSSQGMLALVLVFSVRNAVATPLMYATTTCNFHINHLGHISSCRISSCCLRLLTQRNQARRAWWWSSLLNMHFQILGQTSLLLRHEARRTRRRGKCGCGHSRVPCPVTN